MPYIKKEQRKKHDGMIDAMVTLVTTGNERYLPSRGLMNYIITKLLYGFLPKEYGYHELNAIMGVLSCVQQEFYRRVVVPYENQKKKENGDVF